ncbi:MAG: SH3 domain-containing protein [Clostridia bacterium]|nr:SH3 domain-containing protein [Clostridia bacterium]
MSQGKRIKQVKEPKRKMTREEIEAKKKKIKRRFFIFVALIVLVIAGFIANDYIILDQNEKTSLVINNGNISNLKHDILIEDDVIYISKDDIKNFFDRYIYLDEENNQIITTYDKKIATIGFEGNILTINGANKKIYANAKKEGETIYLPISEMKDVYGIEIENIKDSKVVTIDSIDREQKKAMASKDAAVKSSTGFIAKTIDRINKGAYVIVVSKTDDGWTKIRTPNGKVGYVKNDVVVNEVKIRENMVEEPQIKGKVNMFWDFYSQYANAPTRSEKIEGVNVVSPSFFYINSKAQFKENVGEKGKAYIEWAHNNGYKVWAMLSNSYEDNMIEITSKIMNNYKYRQALIENIVDVCVKYKLDGINIDFENMKKEDIDMFSRFIIELTPRMKEIGLVTSVDVTAPDGGDTWSLCFDRNVIGHVADYIVFMAYDQNGTGSRTAGTTAGYNWTVANLKKFIKTEEVKSSKIILGIPFYTRVWTENTDGKLTSNIVNMKDINKVIPSNAQKQWLDDLKQNYVEYQEKGATKKIWIEDLDSIKAKVSLVNEYELGGVSAWAKDRENPDVWAVIANELK